MPRNFIQNKADISQYYVNRAKKEEEKNQFKVVDTRRVKVPTRNGKSAMNQQQTKSDVVVKPTVQRESTPPVQSESTSQTSAIPDYRFLLTWSYYLATQAAWLSPILQQQGQSPLSLPTDPEATAKFLQAMQTVMNPLTAAQISNNIKNKETIDNGLDSTVKEETTEF
jgi:hypothetical protein